MYTFSIDKLCCEKTYSRHDSNFMQGAATAITLEARSAFSGVENVVELEYRGEKSGSPMKLDQVRSEKPVTPASINRCLVSSFNARSADV
jgi:hypothetical protein